MPTQCVGPNMTPKVEHLTMCWCTRISATPCLCKLSTDRLFQVNIFYKQLSSVYQLCKKKKKKVSKEYHRHDPITSRFNARSKTALFLWDSLISTKFSYFPLCVLARKRSATRKEKRLLSARTGAPTSY